MARQHREDDLQRDVIAFIRLQYPGILAFHCANGGKRNKWEAVRLKRQGVLAGVSDILLYWNGGFGAIELKAGEPKPSKLQAWFGDKLQGFGGKFAVCNSVHQVQETMKAWGVK
jgi:hypothetical protein